MDIDPLTDDVLSLSQAARMLPRLRGGRPVAPSTLWRWAAGGVRGVRLATVKVGGVTCTSTEALRRFFGELNGAPAPAAASERQRLEGVERELKSRHY